MKFKNKHIAFFLSLMFLITFLFTIIENKSKPSSLSKKNKSSQVRNYQQTFKSKNKKDHSAIIRFFNKIKFSQRDGYMFYFYFNSKKILESNVRLENNDFERSNIQIKFENLVGYLTKETKNPLSSKFTPFKINGTLNLTKSIGLKLHYDNNKKTKYSISYTTREISMDSFDLLEITKIAFYKDVIYANVFIHQFVKDIEKNTDEKYKEVEYKEFDMEKLKEHFYKGVYNSLECEDESTDLIPFYLIYDIKNDKCKNNNINLFD